MGGYTGGYIPIDKKSVRNSKHNFHRTATRHTHRNTHRIPHNALIAEGDNNRRVYTMSQVRRYSLLSSFHHLFNLLFHFIFVLKQKKL
jgi:hypothetical protein